ncbi:hypothetical protein FHG87_017221 [Trinorchestia longiramus]|nr:hypothetical protein FHG87_017221 [Trinorchestia longiramus]
MPVAFFSKKLSDLQKTYSTYDRELLAAYLSVLHFKSIIDGHSVTLFTDHKPMVSAFYSRTIAKYDRQQRHLSFLSEYITAVEYIKGHNNIVANCLSRPVCATTVDVFDLHKLASAQADDDEMLSYQDRLTPYEIAPNLTSWCDTSTSSPRPLVPNLWVNYPLGLPNPSVSPANPSVSPANPSVSPVNPSVSPANPSVSPATPSVSPPTAAHFNSSLPVQPPAPPSLPSETARSPSSTRTRSGRTVRFKSLPDFYYFPNS